MKRKTRLTITLSKEILKNVDSLVDGEKVRNRSHAIEGLISKTLKPKAKTAIILAGGEKKGRVFAPLAIINDKSLLEILLTHLKESEVKRVFICAGTEERRIRKYLDRNKFLGLDISYLEERKPFGTAGVIKRLEKEVGDESFLVIHGDVLTQINLFDLMKFHEEEGSVATIAVKPRLAEKKLGKVNLQGNKITEFLSGEKKNGIGIVNTGIYVFSPEIFKFLPSKTPSMLENLVFPKLARRKTLSAFFFQGAWFDIAKEKDLVKARKRWGEKG